MKKIALVLALVLSLSVAVCAVAQETAVKDDVMAPLNSLGKIRVADPALYSYNPKTRLLEYVDYAKVCYFDTEKYPDLDSQGMFWSYWDDDTESIVMVPADSEEGAALVDPSKPTLINIHGMMTDGYAHQQFLNFGDNCGRPEEFGLDWDSINFARLLMQQGWNIAFFHYNRFASELFPTDIEAKIWSHDIGNRYQQENRNYVENATEFSVGEHFAAEYIRMLQYLPDGFGEKEIRVVAHSMGGEVGSSGIFLLTELADVGQFAKSKLPDRYTMLDTYFSINKTIQTSQGDKVFSLGREGLHVSWSGKPMPNDNTGDAVIEALRDLEANGIALDYYSCQTSTLKAFMADHVYKTLREISVCVEINLVWTDYNSKFTMLTNGHEAIRSWYFTSCWFGDVLDTDGEKAPYFYSTSEEIIAMKGRYYLMRAGETTVPTSDDLFEITDIVS